MNVSKYLTARKSILEALLNRNKWGGSHTSYKRMFVYIAKHERGRKETKKAAADLIKEGKIMLKKTVEDDHVSLNSRLLKEIYDEIEGGNNV